MIGNYNKNSVRNILVNEGIPYAIDSFMSGDEISKSEPDLRKNWKLAHVKMNELYQYLKANKNISKEVSEFVKQEGPHIFFTKFRKDKDVKEILDTDTEVKKRVSETLSIIRKITDELSLDEQGDKINGIVYEQNKQMKDGGAIRTVSGHTFEKNVPHYFKVGVQGGHEYYYMDRAGNIHWVNQGTHEYEKTTLAEYSAKLDDVEEFNEFVKMIKNDEVVESVWIDSIKKSIVSLKKNEHESYANKEQKILDVALADSSEKFKKGATLGSDKLEILKSNLASLEKFLPTVNEDLKSSLEKKIAKLKMQIAELEPTPAKGNGGLISLKKYKTFNNYYDQIVKYIESTEEITRGDAQGIADAHDADMQRGWSEGVSAIKMAEQILGLGTKKLKQGATISHKLSATASDATKTLKFEKVMHEWKKGRLKTFAGVEVKYPDDKSQAIAIAYSESGLDKK